MLGAAPRNFYLRIMLAAAALAFTAALLAPVASLAGPAHLAAVPVGKLQGIQLPPGASASLSASFFTKLREAGINTIIDQRANWHPATHQQLMTLATQYGVRLVEPRQPPRTAAQRASLSASCRAPRTVITTCAVGSANSGTARGLLKQGHVDFVVLRVASPTAFIQARWPKSKRTRLIVVVPLSVKTTVGSSWKDAVAAAGASPAVGLAAAPNALSGPGLDSYLGLVSTKKVAGAPTGPADTQAPSTPGNMALVGNSVDSLTVGWNPARDDIGVAGYEVFLNGVSKGVTKAHSFVVAGLDCGTVFTVGVEAYDLAGNHSPRALIDGMTMWGCYKPGGGGGGAGGGGSSPPTGPDTGAPSAPSGIAQSFSTQTSATVSWSDSTDNVGVTGYGIYVGILQVATTATASYTLSGLTCGSSSSIAIDARDAAGNHSGRTSFVASAAACSSDTQPPSVPSSLTKTASTATTIAVSWPASTDNVGVTGYRLFLSGSPVGTTTARVYTFSGLACGTSYSVAVAAYDLAGNISAQTSAIMAAAACPPSADTTAPTAPGALNVGAVTQTSIALSWAASTDNVAVTGYGIYRNGSSVGSAATASYTVGGLACGTSYTLGVDAYDAAGNRSSRTNTVLSTSACPDTTAPSTPTGAAAGSVTQTGLTLSWSASTDNVGVAGYGVYNGAALAGSTAATSYTLPGLICGTSYSFSVDAYDGAGNRSPKASVTASTSACSPPPPPPVGSANLWVDPSGGSCVRQGSPAGYVDAQACSWSQAYQAAQTGDLILVKGGSYGNVTIGPNKPSIAAPGVTFRTATGETVTVNDLENGYIFGANGGNNISFVGPATARTFRSDGTSNITVDNWVVDCNGCDNVQIFHLEGGNNVTVKNSDISDNKNNSLIYLDGSNYTFENNKIHDAGLPNGSGSHTECMYANDVTNLTLKRNHFYHCSVMDVFITGGSGVSNGGYIENNVFEKPWENTGVISNTALAFHFRNGGNPSPDPNNWDFRYNTFVGPLSITPSENPVGPGGMRIIGNAFLADGPCGQANTTYDYNAFVTGNGCGTHAITNSLAAYLAGFTTTADPGDYSLKAVSILRDKGNPANYPTQDRTGSNRYTGNAPDLGAYEGP